jgi:TatD DNase family protein
MKKTALIDTHAHIADPVFDPDRKEVLERAQASGVAAVVTVSENLRDAVRILKLAEQYPMLLPAAGIAPPFLESEDPEPVLSFIRREKSGLSGIGEVGLDYWIAKEEAQRDLQRDVFKCFIELSKELDLPLNIHSRSAGRHVIELLLRQSARKVQLHAFDGKASSALPGAEEGYFFSIPPSIVRSPQKQKLVRLLPLSSMLVETDSPVLGPSREERNEPANVLVSVNAIAEIKGIRKEEVLEAVSQNAWKLYGENEKIKLKTK